MEFSLNNFTEKYEDSLNELSLLELKELKKLLQERFNVISFKDEFETNSYKTLLRVEFKIYDKNLDLELKFSFYDFDKKIEKEIRKEKIKNLLA